MNHIPSNASSFRIPTIVWVLFAAVIVAGVAIFVFKVPIGTVFTFGLFGFMMLSHLFIHGSHGSHGNNSNNNATQNGENSDPKTNNQLGRSGRCH